MHPSNGFSGLHKPLGFLLTLLKTICPNLCTLVFNADQISLLYAIPINGLCDIIFLCLFKPVCVTETKPGICICSN